MEAQLIGGNDITLSIDIGIQAILERKYQTKLTKFEAIGRWRSARHQKR